MKRYIFVTFLILAIGVLIPESRHVEANNILTDPALAYCPYKYGPENSASITGGTVVYQWECYPHSLNDSAYWTLRARSGNGERYRVVIKTTYYGEKGTSKEIIRTVGSEMGTFDSDYSSSIPMVTFRLAKTDD